MSSLPQPRPAAKAGAAILLAWTLAALVGAAQETLTGGALGGATASFWSTLRVYAAHLWLWAAATPAILWTARRFPVAGAVRWRNLALHIGLGSAFVLAFNVAIRLPMPVIAADAVPLADLWTGSLLGFARWYHLALIVYLGLVALGHALPRGTDTVTPAGPVAPRPAPGRLAVHGGDGIRLIPTDEIDWIEADDDHVRIYAGERAYRGRERLGELERRLAPSGFVRIHRSALVRAAAVRALRPAGRGDYTVVLRTGRELRLPRTRAAMLEALVGRPL